MSLSEQAVSFMAAAAAAYGPRALAPHAEAAPDTPEALGRSLLRMVPGDPVPLADFLASPADPARRAELEDWLYDALDEQPGLRAAMTTALTGYSRRRAAAGDARALADLGDLLSWQDEFEAARDAYQQAVDLGHDRALLSLASLVRECLGDADGARMPAPGHRLRRPRRSRRRHGGPRGPALFRGGHDRRPGGLPGRDRHGAPHVGTRGDDGAGPLAEHARGS